MKGCVETGWTRTVALDLCEAIDRDDDGRGPSPTPGPALSPGPCANPGPSPRPDPVPSPGPEVDR